MKIAIASDHAGVDLKNALFNYLHSKKINVTDLGPTTADRVDYPDFAEKVAKGVSSQEFSRGILVCGSGIGMCMAANRFSGVRAAVIRNAYDAKMSRAHNDSNVACFGGRVTSNADAMKWIDLWLNEAFEGGRHAGRVKKLG